MSFIIDKVSEDSFYENLLLGISKILEKNPCVSNISLQRFSGARQLDIRNWEHNNGVILPDDLRAFYLSTNGFFYTYHFCYNGSSCQQKPQENGLVRIGRIEVNPIEELARTFGYETKNKAAIERTETDLVLTLSRDSKIFEICSVENYGKVVLVYLNSYSLPNIWFFSSPLNFSYIADDFTTYFRMSIAHLGIPCWQCVVSKEGLPEWSKEIFNILAPGVLLEDKSLMDLSKYNIEANNVIDSSIFFMNQNNANFLQAEQVDQVVPHLATVNNVRNKQTAEKRIKHLIRKKGKKNN